MMQSSEKNILSDLIINNSGSPRILLKALNYALNHNQSSPLPPHKSASELANDFMDSFIAKVDRIQNNIIEKKQDLKVTSFPEVQK